QLGLQLQACAEIEPYCCDILAKRYPKAYNLGDINECQWDSIKSDLGDIDLISASPPCQPFSIQGKRQGAKDKRDCIPAVQRAIALIRPKYFCIENVTGLLSCPHVPGADRPYFQFLLEKLSQLGYDAEWLTVSSGHFAAPFCRERLLLVGISQRLKPFRKRAASWTLQAGKSVKEARTAQERRGIKPGYPLEVVRNPRNLARPLGVKSGNGIIRKQRSAAGNLLDHRVAGVALRRVLYLESLQ
ncbi:MAG: DNA (cytosine-5-)-methyltransferase, partial [Okeania sp. SIO2D1]|nr:DNA (cytosine-5-)-methyltransferase [Okeania sp. SIO2D1]